MTNCAMPGCTEKGTEKFDISTSPTGETLKTPIVAWFCKFHAREIISERVFHQKMGKKPARPAHTERVTAPPTEVIPPVEVTSPPVETLKTCIEPGCEKPQLWRGFCKRHYNQRRKQDDFERLALPSVTGMERKPSSKLNRSDLERRFEALRMIEKIDAGQYSAEDLATITRIARDHYMAIAYAGVNA